jgi:hypothetical protein
MGLELTLPPILARATSKKGALLYRARQRGTRIELALVSTFKRAIHMIMSTTQRLRAVTALLVVGSLGATACASMNKKQEGAVIGAAAGGAIGGVIGNQTGSTA